MGMRLSIIIPVLNSHEVVRRQLLHFSRIGLVDTELILVDDGSDPPLANTSDMPVRIHRTYDQRPWTWALARNAGALMARGEYLLMFDVDHILPSESYCAVRAFDGVKMRFKRQFGVLDGDGRITQDRDVLQEYGLPRDRDLTLTPLPNNFVMRRDVYWEIGGYREDLFEKPYPQGEDRLWKKAWHGYMRATGTEEHPHSPTLFMFPSGKWIGDVDADPKGLFHGLTRKTRRNYWHQQQQRKQSAKS